MVSSLLSLVKSNILGWATMTIESFINECHHPPYTIHIMPYALIVHIPDLDIPVLPVYHSCLAHVPCLDGDVFFFTLITLLRVCD